MSSSKDSPHLAGGSAPVPGQRTLGQSPAPRSPAADGQRKGPAFYSLLDGPAGRAQKPGAAAAGPSARTVELVQQSWAKVLPISDAAAALFYDRLFELDPSVRPMFKPDISDQKKKLMQTLTVAVDGLNNLGKLVPVLQALGVRHAGYMVQDRHYDLVGEALLWTLKEGLGDAFTKEVETAWTEIYSLVADVMKKAAAEQSEPGGAPAKPHAPAARKPAARGIVVPSAADPSRALDTPAPESVPLAGRTLVGVSGPTAAESPADGAKLSRRTIDLVQQSWAKVLPISDAAAALFYDRLFELDPSVRPMFKPDIGDQKKKLMQTLTVAVDGLNNLGKLVPVLQALGVRHEGYMVQDHHYDLVGEALLWTLKEGLGDAFTKEVEAAWTEVYGLVASVMKTAAATHAGGATPRTGRSASPDEALPQRVSLDDDAATLHYDPPSHRLAADEGARARQRGGSVERTPVPGTYTPPYAEPQGARGLVVPIGGQDMILNVHLKMDAPLVQIPEPRAQPQPASSGLASGAFLSLVCVGASMGVTILLSMGGRGEGGLPPTTLYGVPLMVMILVFGAFSLGHLWGRDRAPADGAERPRRR